MISKPYFRQLVTQLPNAKCAVTRHVVTGELVGITVDQVHEGVMVLDPFDGHPIAWQDIDGVPHWRVGDHYTTGSYRSEFVSRTQLLSLLS